MTPLQFAREECANLAVDGTCWRLEPSKDADDRASGDGSDHRCLIGHGERCDYFERCILPLADHPNPVDDPGLNNRRATARSTYLRLHDLPGAEQPSKQCGDCGQPVPKGRRYCDTCRSKRRRDTYRRRGKNDQSARNSSDEKQPRKSLQGKERKSAKTPQGVRIPFLLFPADNCGADALERP